MEHLLDYPKKWYRYNSYKGMLYLAGDHYIKYVDAVCENVYFAYCTIHNVCSSLELATQGVVVIFASTVLLLILQYLKYGQFQKVFFDLVSHHRA